MKIAVLGAGALGCYYGSVLAQAGEDVHYIMRSDYTFVSQHGLQVNSRIQGLINLPAVHVYKSSADVGPVDLVLITWKTTSNHFLSQALPPLCSSNTIVLTLQNGMGNAEAIAQLLPQEKILVGQCFICSMKVSPGHISHLSGGNIQLAPMLPSNQAAISSSEYIAALFKKNGIPARAFENAEQIQWYKLVWNIPFNGLCLALGGISINTLYSIPANVQRAKKIMEEVSAVAHARGCNFPNNLIESQMEKTKNMGEFIPSSAIDYKEHRPVEYEAIWGIPLKIARSTGLALPNWSQLDQDIRQRLNMPAQSS